MRKPETKQRVPTPLFPGYGGCDVFGRGLQNGGSPLDLAFHAEGRGWRSLIECCGREKGRIVMAGGCRMVLVMGANMLLLAAGVGQANVFDMPGGQASLQFVSVGDPGNAADSMGYGSVPYVYRMGEYDVTVAQYCQFLNAVAATDTYGLYNGNMASGPVSNDQLPTVGIIQSGSPGSYTYSVSYNSTAWSTYPVNLPTVFHSASLAANDSPICCVNWGDAARFCNWLQNGQPTFPAAAPARCPARPRPGRIRSTAIRQATMSPVTHGRPTPFPRRTNGPRRRITTRVRARIGTIRRKATRTPPTCCPIRAWTNANYNDAADSSHTGNGGYTDAANYVTPVGAFPSSPGPFGTYNMGGDVFQWIENRHERIQSWRGLLVDRHQLHGLLPNQLDQPAKCGR